MNSTVVKMKKQGSKMKEHLASSETVDQKIWSLFQMKEQPRILLYDDDPIFCDIMAATAKKKNIHLTICRNLNELLRKWESKPDLVLLDCNLDEDLKGQDVARLIEKTPVILISESKPSASVKDANVKGFIEKVIGPSKLLKRALAEGKKSEKWSNYCA
ncbi:response regulator [Oligoflexaceae bacterium]|nr:response regulator [Oligoflexaceae bacterium]